MNRRDYLAIMGAAAGGIATASQLELVSAQEPRPVDPGTPTTSTVADRTRRMKWWHEAKFGMFIHWGLYSTLGRHEWVMENEGIPAKEYEPYADNSSPSQTQRERGHNRAQGRNEIHGDDYEAP